MNAMLVFYDGNCGLCHGAVKFILPRDPQGTFKFAPIDSAAFRQRTQNLDPAKIPDSIIVISEQQIFFESDAAAAILKELNGIWPLLGHLLALVPKPLRDAGYRLVARNRKRFFKPPTSACPIVPAQYAARFFT